MNTPPGRAVFRMMVLWLVTLSLVSCGTNSSKKAEPAKRCTSVTGRLVPRCGALWGVSIEPSRGTGELAALQRIEAAAGRKMAIVHVYHDMSAGPSGTFPDAAEQQAGDGRLLYIAWASRRYDITNYRWSQIASGELDATVIDPAARRVAAYQRPMFIDFDHEAETHRDDGSDADFVAAYRHVRDRFMAAGATNAVWVWAVTGYRPHWPRYKAMYPGDDVVDWVAWDPYNFAACHRTEWQSFEQSMDRFYRWLIRRHPGKPLMLAEYGTVPSPDGPAATARWYDDVVPTLRRHPQISAAVQFDYHPTTGAACDTRLVPDQVLSSWSRAGRDSFVNPPLPTR